jgi:hypothetical protein
VDHQGAQHSTKIGNFRTKAWERAFAKSSWMKGRVAAWAVVAVAADASNTDSRSFLIAAPLKQL